MRGWGHESLFAIGERRGGGHESVFAIGGVSYHTLHHDIDSRPQ